MRSLLATFRLGTTVLFTLTCFASHVITIPFCRGFGIPIQKTRYPVLRFWSRGMLRIFGMRLKIQGTAPESPFLLLSNHLSYLDPVLLFTHVDCVFVAKREIRSWPVLGFIVKTMGALFIDRQRRSDIGRVTELLRRNIHEHQGVVLFPEGTTSNGAAVLPIRSSLLQPAAEGAFPVRIAVVRYETPEGEAHASESVCWWGNHTFFSHIWRLAHLKGIQAEVIHEERVLHVPDRKEMAREVHRTMSRLFRPVIATSEIPASAAPST